MSKQSSSPLLALTYCCLLAIHSSAAVAMSCGEFLGSSKVSSRDAPAASIVSGNELLIKVQKLTPRRHFFIKERSAEGGDPVSMVKMSALGYSIADGITVDSPLGEQTKPAGQDAYLVFDELKQQYFMINAGADGLPLNHIPAQVSVREWFKQPHVEKVNLELLLEEFLRRGYSINKLIFEFNCKGGQASRAVIHLNVKYEGETILEMRFLKNGASAGTFTEPIHANFRNTGLGTLAYLIAAKVVYKQYGALISSDYVGGHPQAESKISDAALKVWNRFTYQRLAKFEDQHFSFIPESIEQGLGALNPIFANQTYILGY